MLTYFSAICSILGVTGIGLSQRTGLSPSVISAIKTGRTKPSKVQLRMIASALRVRQRDLVGVVEMKDIVGE